MSRSAQTPPVAPVIEHHETRHGTTVSDNYFWLREKSNPQVIKYLEAENAYTEAMIKICSPTHSTMSVTGSLRFTSRTYVVALRSPIPSSVSTALPGLRTTRRCF